MLLWRRRRRGRPRCIGPRPSVATLPGSSSINLLQPHPQLPVRLLAHRSACGFRTRKIRIHIRVPVREDNRRDLPRRVTVTRLDGPRKSRVDDLRYRRGIQRGERVHGQRDFLHGDDVLLELLVVPPVYLFPGVHIILHVSHGIHVVLMNLDETLDLGVEYVEESQEVNNILSQPVQKFQYFKNDTGEYFLRIMSLRKLLVGIHLRASPSFRSIHQ
jgi:hypothetical protein